MKEVERHCNNLSHRASLRMVARVTVFGDYEPEDAWDADDDTSQLTHLLYQMIALLDGYAGYQVRRMDPLDEIEGRLTAWTRPRQGSLTAREQLRVQHITEGIAHLRARI